MFKVYTLQEIICKVIIAKNNKFTQGGLMKVYTVEEIASILKVSTFTVRNYIKDGKLIAIKTGGAIRVSEDNLKAFIEGK